METIADLLQGGADDATAIGAPERDPPLTYGQLRGLLDATRRDLNALGIGRNDRVALALPNGPELAAAFVSVAACATAAPLSPGLTADEFKFNLVDLPAKALLVQDGLPSPAREVAAELGVRVVELVPDPSGGTGAFALKPSSSTVAVPARGGPAGPEDVALVLHTSGSTSRPKIVPLLHRNVTASARNIERALQLTSEDVCLNIMPLFHIHGLMAAVLASLGAGGQVWCSPGFNALRFFHWLDEVRPTWYTAVPTMHQAILSRAARHAEELGRARLRVIRSSSASLAPQVMAELERTFRCPVIEAYGMTEAAHQMTSNPLPPREHRAGSVGIPAGPQVRIMDEGGKILPRGHTGEVVIRGPNVTP